MEAQREAMTHGKWRSQEMTEPGTEQNSGPCFASELQFPQVLNDDNQTCPTRRGRASGRCPACSAWRGWRPRPLHAGPDAVPAAVRPSPQFSAGCSLLTPGSVCAENKVSIPAPRVGLFRDPVP